jgi:ATP-dependent Lon protease
MVGVTTGLAWTEVGGELLTIEAVTLPGKGRVTATGKLGDVMKESVQAAESYVKARSHAFGIRPQIFEKKDIHVHVPEGATPKDGPSAGVGMVTSIVSVLTGIAVKRDIAMTGEITLRGRVLPIGGLKEKLLAALRGGLKAVLIPGENEKDLAEIPDNVKRGLKIIPVHTVDELLAHALAKPLTPIAWEEESEPPPVIPASGEERSGVLTH